MCRLVVMEPTRNALLAMGSTVKAVSVSAEFAARTRFLTRRNLPVFRDRRVLSERDMFLRVPRALTRNVSNAAMMNTAKGDSERAWHAVSMKFQTRPSLPAFRARRVLLENNMCLCVPRVSILNVLSAATVNTAKGG